MSGIALAIHLDGRPAQASDLAPMMSEMARRGPDGESVVLAGSVALGHRHLPTTPEALVESMPLSDPKTGCILTGDIRLDNRDELSATLNVPLSGDRVVGDGELVLHAWERWGEECAAHLLGDFAFALWDPRLRKVFAARDQMGMRQLIYSHRPGHVFVCASSARAVALQSHVRTTLNEQRFAEALIGFQHGSLTSTFYEGVVRMPPGHCLSVTGGQFSMRAYWHMAPPEPLRLKSDAEYAEAFHEMHATAVQARLRSAGPVGSMLSGGIDSGSVVAQASRLLSEPLPTFSASGPDPALCGETQAIHDTLALPNLAPTVVDYSDLDSWQDDLIAATRALEEPWDFNMILIRSVYLAAKRAGVKVVLDGGVADVALARGDQMVRQVASGHWYRAWQDAKGLSENFGWGAAGTKSQLLEAFRGAFVPDFLRRLRASWRERQPTKLPEENVIAEPFAERSGLLESLREWHQPRPGSAGMSFAERKIALWPRTGTAVGRERYDRVAAHFGVEPRDPFMDRRLIEFCLSLPYDQLQHGGWPKIILRRSMARYLPGDLCWRRGRHHLGPEFTEQTVSRWPNWRSMIEHSRPFLEGKVRSELLSASSWQGKAFTKNPVDLEMILGIAAFAQNDPVLALSD